MDAADNIKLFTKLLRQYGGETYLDNLFTDYPSAQQDIHNIKTGNIENSWFRINRKQISAFLPGLGICFDYNSGGICDRHCGKLHLCVDFLLSSCSRGSKCKLFHRLKNEHNVCVLRSLEIGGLAEEDVILYLKFKAHKNGRADPGSALEHCSSEKDSDAFKKENSEPLLGKDSVGETKNTLQVVDKSMSNYNSQTCGAGSIEQKRAIDHVEQIQESRDTYIKLKETPAITEELVLMENGTNNDIENRQLKSMTVRDKTINSVSALKFLLTQENGRCGIDDFSKGTGMKDRDAAIRWINGPIGKKICKLFNPDNLVEPTVVTMIPHLELCSAYVNLVKGCTKDHCLQIHMCRNFLERSCLKESCELSHYVTHPRNMRIWPIYISDFNSLDRLEILKVVEFSLPQVCTEYNSEEGCANPACTRFHVCAEFVKGRCFLGRDNCNYEHNLSSFFNRTLTAFYGIEERVLLGTMIVPGYKELISIPSVEMIHLLPQILDTRTKVGTVEVCDPSTKLSKAILPSTKNKENAHMQVYLGGHAEAKGYNEDKNDIVQCNLDPHDSDPSFWSLKENIFSPICSSLSDSPGDDNNVEVSHQEQHFSRSVDDGENFVDSDSDIELLYHAISNSPEVVGKNSIPDSKTPQQKVLKSLIASTHGCRSLAELQKILYQEFPTTSDLLAFLLSPSGEKICVMQIALTPEETMVILLVPKFQLCFDHSSNRGCSLKNCPYLHLCRAYVNGRCSFGEHCKYSHNVQSDHNQRVVILTQVSFESAEDTIAAVRHSMPKVCEGFNSSQGCRKPTCTRFHICANYVQKVCSFPNCKKGHHLQTPYNTNLMETLGFKERVAFKMLMVTFPTEAVILQNQLKTHKPEVAVLGRIDKLEVVRCLLDNEDQVFVEELIKLEQFKEFTINEMLKWFQTPAGQEMFRLFPEKSFGKYVVCLGIKSLQLCIGYCQWQGCLKQDCPYLHICREYVAGRCKRQHCKFTHNLRIEHNRDKIHKAGIEPFTDQDIMKAIRRSLPCVCPDYNSGSGCNKNVCVMFHVCGDKIRQRCQYGYLCKRDHNMKSHHNQKLRKVHGKDEYVINLTLIIPNTDQKVANPPEKRVHGNVVRDKLYRQRLDDFLPQMLDVFDGFCSINQFLATFPLVLSSTEPLTLTDNKAKVFKYMTLFKLEEKLMVLAKMDWLNLCCSYLGPKGCCKLSCRYLHLCRDFLMDSCTESKPCNLSHNIKDEHNSKILIRVGIPRDLLDNSVIKLIKNSIPTVCVAHNSKKGCSSEACYRFHVCSQYVIRNCPKSFGKCNYGHSFQTEHNKDLLEVYRCTSEDIMKRMICVL